ncbi:hypothetical protein ACR78Z_21125 [Sphingobacterium thalpophilum]|uniref:hypothetical protein n=1 Tax=Sphingobacterium thalpophilum TaxID=259 RepID=UPI003DA59970
MAASSGAARPPLRSGAKIGTFGTNFQDFCAYFFRFCPNPLDRWTIVFETACSGTAEQGPQGREGARSRTQFCRTAEGRADPEDGLPELGHGHPAPDADKARSSSGSAVHRSWRKHGAARTHALRTDYKRIRRPIKGTCAEAN